MNRIIFAVVLCVDLIWMFHQNDYTVVYHHMELMEYNNSLLQNVRLLNVKPNRTFRAFSVYYKSTTDWFPKDISVNIAADRILNYITKLRIAQFSVPLCSILEKRLYGTDFVFDHSNLTQCPIKKGYYAIENFILDPKHLPPLIPEGKYVVTFTMFSKGTLMGKARLFNEVIYLVKYKPRN